jgi:cytochrome c553
MLPGMLERPSGDSVGRGATLALQCTVCHGARGVSNADTPNLAGQYALVRAPL